MPVKTFMVDISYQNWDTGQGSIYPEWIKARTLEEAEEIARQIVRDAGPDYDCFGVKQLSRRRIRLARLQDKYNKYMRWQSIGHQGRAKFHSKRAMRRRGQSQRRVA